ncbi:hypothetical protein B0H65DRAFT_181888 [Neurospora tetraspora]|uniref:Uncharacterized protein n=1 Tax=Neurospora tetraspora TaxID=94610 RepID=A0AAE0JE45_9PEZI|nr:hypothetical protein B0H65DRAFT_181888 [Neurospora tetraspora]
MEQAQARYWQISGNNLFAQWQLGKLKTNRRDILSWRHDYVVIALAFDTSDVSIVGLNNPPARGCSVCQNPALTSMLENSSSLSYVRLLFSVISSKTPTSFSHGLSSFVPAPSHPQSPTTFSRASQTTCHVIPPWPGKTDWIWCFSCAPVPDCDAKPSPFHLFRSPFGLIHTRQCQPGRFDFNLRKGDKSKHPPALTPYVTQTTYLFVTPLHKHAEATAMTRFMALGLPASSSSASSVEKRPGHGRGMPCPHPENRNTPIHGENRNKILEMKLA